MRVSSIDISRLSLVVELLLTAIVFVYDYHPLASTLYEQHLSPQALSAALRDHPSRHPQHFNPHTINERVLWSYIIQLANVIRTVHATNLAVRTIEPSKILITGRNRLRVSCCSILDVLRSESDSTLQNQQVSKGSYIAWWKLNSANSAYSKRTYSTWAK